MAKPDDSNIYDEIEIEDMTYDAALQVYHYPCPCGDRFEISLEDLRDQETDIGVCPSCSLQIRVIYEVEDLPKPQDERKKAMGGAGAQVSVADLSEAVRPKAITNACDTSQSMAQDVVDAVRGIPYARLSGTVRGYMPRALAARHEYWTSKWRTRQQMHS
ncbi:Diphthamide biosynthesis protein 3 [Teratosphaeriaceae sp. CCFEE 6253]|nr:Diphthamide biosynthesis protein 3 [Teratosphaeriaceae sp. CCFEE 6253]